MLIAWLGFAQEGKQPVRKPIPVLKSEFNSTSPYTPLRKQVEALTGCPAKESNFQAILAELSKARRLLREHPSEAGLLRVELLRLAIDELMRDPGPAPSWGQRTTIKDPEIARVYLLTKTNVFAYDSEDAATRLCTLFPRDFRLQFYRCFLVSMKRPPRYAFLKDLSEQLMSLRPDRGEGYLLRAFAEEKQDGETSHNPKRKRALPFLAASVKRPNRLDSIARNCYRIYKKELDKGE